MNLKKIKVPFKAQHSTAVCELPFSVVAFEGYSTNFNIANRS